MSDQPKIRRKTRPDPVCRWALAALLAAMGAICGQAQNQTQKQAQQQTQNQPQVQPANTVVLDQVVAVVNNHPILASDVDNEMRLAVLDPGQAGLGLLTPSRALEQLISRALIQQQIHEEDEQVTEPSQAEVDARLEEIRKELPTCVRFNCASQQGWKKFLAAHGLTPEQVESYLRFRLQILSFIEMRFRQGIRITPEEIKSYYTKTLLPQYAVGEATPSLDKVAPRIQEILLERQVNVLFDDWLDNLRKQGDVEVLDPAFEAPSAETPAGEGKGGV